MGNKAEDQSSLRDRDEESLLLETLRRLVELIAKRIAEELIRRERAEKSQE